MLIDQLRNKWRERPPSASKDILIKLAPDGVALGDHMLLANRDISLGGYLGRTAEDRAQALLAVVYGAKTATAALGHIKLAATHWRDGRQERAGLHLALARLPSITKSGSTAERVFMADELMRAGVCASDIFAIIAANEFEALVAKAYDPEQPRVPAGSGRPSGQWTDGSPPPVGDRPIKPTASPPSGAATVSTSSGITAPSTAEAPTPQAPEAAPPAQALSAENYGTPATAITVGEAGAITDGASVAFGRGRLAALLAGLNASQLAELALVAARFTAPTAALGYVFFPTDMKLRVEGDVAGIPGLHYKWNRDDTHMVLTYTPPEGGAQRTVITTLESGKFRNSRGDVVAATLPNGGVIVDPSAVGAIAVARAKAELCPGKVPDYLGDGPNGGGYRFALFAKLFVNPEEPTPPGFGYGMPNPTGGETVYDDCQLLTGRFYEFKGDYSFFTANAEKFPKSKIPTKWLNQSERQLNSSDGHQLTWLFSNETDANYARRLFSAAGDGREFIDIEVLPWRKIIKCLTGSTKLEQLGSVARGPSFR